MPPLASERLGTAQDEFKAAGATRVVALVKEDLENEVKEFRATDARNSRTSSPSPCATFTITQSIYWGTIRFGAGLMPCLNARPAYEQIINNQVTKF